MLRCIVILRLVLSFTVLAGLSSMLSGERPYVPHTAGSLVELWRWNNFPELDGAGVRHIIESSDGKVWVGAGKGVLEYDGYEWIAHAEEEGLPEGPVEQLLETSDRTIYATTQKGIYRYDGGRWTPFYLVNSTRSFSFHRMKELYDGTIMVCTNWGFIHFLENDQLNFYSSQEKIDELSPGMPGINWIPLPEEALFNGKDFDDTSDVLPVSGGEVWFAITSSPLMRALPGFPAIKLLAQKTS